MGALGGLKDGKEARRVKGLGRARRGMLDGGGGLAGQDHGSQTAVSSWGEERS